MTSKHRKNRARKIRELTAKGVSGKELAKRFGISTSYVSLIIANRKQPDPDYSGSRPKLGNYIAEIKELRQHGRTYAEIGEQLGLQIRKKAYSESAVRWAMQNNDVLQRTNGSTSEETPQGI